MNRSIEVIGKVKTNKNQTNYIDTAEGRVYLGKVSGFKAGDEIMGTAICSPQTVNYPEQAAVGVAGQPNYRPAVAASTETSWKCDNFITEEMQTKQLEAKARKAKATLAIAITERKAAETATLDTVDLWQIPA